ncbi:hypothetical protein FBU59_000194 [Linderina macrospora]|uniref:Uncharacterized protein n=1 Tax=Linderina macrospora TaxID=4868 RepID=A0ACC1JHQ3_9FUNG|nr:hypothetical protein FBU59_000194 [Linderina macrospora]
MTNRTPMRAPKTMQQITRADDHEYCWPPHESASKTSTILASEMNDPPKSTRSSFSLRVPLGLGKRKIVMIIPPSSTLTVRLSQNATRQRPFSANAPPITAPAAAAMDHADEE